MTRRNDLKVYSTNKTLFNREWWKKPPKDSPPLKGRGLGVGSVMFVISRDFLILTPPLPLPYMGGEFVLLQSWTVNVLGDGERFGYPLCKQFLPTAIKKEIAP